MTRSRLLALGLVAALGIAAPAAARAQGTRLRDLITHANDVPRRLVGYGLVVGLAGTGDRSMGDAAGGVHTVRSVLNLLQRFGIAVPPDRIRLNNVAAVLVTAEISPFLRAGNHFDVQVASVGDATSLRGGVLWMTPLIADVGAAPVATAQGALLASDGEVPGIWARGGTSARIPAGGLLEVDSGTTPFASGGGQADTLRLLLRQPSLDRAAHIAATINAAYGAGVARVEDPGSVRLVPSAQLGDTVAAFLAALDTLSVTGDAEARLVVDVRDGVVAVGGNLRIGAATVSRAGLTLTIGGATAATAPAGGAAASAGAPVPNAPAAAPATSAPGEVHAEVGATVQDVAAALHAAGATPRDVAAIFEALVAAGALPALVVLR
jgi:flagellar P-ring protein precursor FlgI